jgi:hypothetical protein
MVYSLRDYLFQPDNLQLWDPVIPKKLDLGKPAPPAPHPRPEVPPIFPQPNPDNPWGDPHYVDPPKGNPFNNRNGRFVVTENLSRQVGDESGGGLLGRLLALMQQGQVRSGADSVSTSNGVPENNSDSYGSPQGLLGRLFALQDEQARNASDAFGGYDPHGTAETGRMQLLRGNSRPLRRKQSGSFLGG